MIRFSVPDAQTDYIDLDDGPLLQPEGINFQVGLDSRLYNSAGPLEVVGDAGHIRIDAAALSWSDINLDVSGRVEAITVANRGESVSADVSALSIGGIAIDHINGSSGSAEVSAHAYDGSIGNIRINVLGASSSADVDASAYSGNVGNIDIRIVGPASDCDISAHAYGGSIGNLNYRVEGASGSGYIYLSAFAEVNDAGRVVGGNIGNITVSSVAANSADVDVYAYAYGELVNGVYAGGGQIGNLNLIAGGVSAELDSSLYAYSGGSIGNITLTLKGKNSYSGDVSARAEVYGVDGKLGTIGNVSVNIGNSIGTENEGDVDLYAYSGGTIGNISMVSNSKGTDDDLGANVRAFENAQGGGGTIGNISLKNTSNGDGDVSAYVEADNRIGNIELSTTGIGDTEAELILRGDADVGNISVTLGLSDRSLYYGSLSGENGWTDSTINIRMDGSADGSVIGDIRVTGGSRELNTGFLLNGNDNWWAGEFGSAYVGSGYGAAAEQIGLVDFSRFEGAAWIDLSDVLEGTAISASKNGSFIYGTEGSDSIRLGAGVDYVNMVEDDFSGVFDRILSFQTKGAQPGGDVLRLGTGQWEGRFVNGGGSGYTFEAGDIVGLVDARGGADLSTAAGLANALVNQREFGNLLAYDDGPVFFLTGSADASSGDSSSSNTRRGGSFGSRVEQKEWSIFVGYDTDANNTFDTFDLLARVSGDGDLASLDSSNFAYAYEFIA